MAPRRLRSPRAVIVLAAIALCAGVAGVGCSQSAEFDQAAKPAEAKTVSKPAAKKVTMPGWVTTGFELAEREINKRRPLTRPETSPEFRVDDESETTGLPSKTEFVALLQAAGLDAKSAECVYTNVSTGPVAQVAATLIGSLTGSAATLGSIAGGSPLAGLDQAEIQQFLVAIAPCIPAETMVALLAAAGGSTGTPSLDSLASLAGLSPSTLAALVAAIGSSPGNVDIAALAKIAGVTLTPEQAGALQAILSGTIPGVADPSKIDFANLDPATLGPEGVTQLLFGLAAGLTESQRQQLVRVANVNLSKLDLELDPSTIGTDQAGALLVLLLPFLSASFAPPAGGAPVGSDPGSIYVPPGTDLSTVNPLYFVQRENLVAGLMGEGVNENAAGCLYDKLRTIQPAVLGQLFSGNWSGGGSEALLAVVGCAITGGA